MFKLDCFNKLNVCNDALHNPCSNYMYLYVTQIQTSDN